MKIKIKEIVLFYVVVEFLLLIATLLVGFVNVIKNNDFWPPLNDIILVNCIVLAVVTLTLFVITPLFIYIIEHTNLFTDK